MVVSSLDFGDGGLRRGGDWGLGWRDGTGDTVSRFQGLGFRVKGLEV